MTNEKVNKKNSNYLSGKEIRKIAKENHAITKKLEHEKSRKKKEEEFTSSMKNPNNILEIDDLHTYFFTDLGVVKAVNGVSFSIPLNSTIGVVGESGCGKSVTAMSVMRLIQGPYGQIVDGAIRFRANDYKKDSKGKYIPIYEYDSNGNIVKEEVKLNSNKKYVSIDDLIKQDDGVYTSIYDRDKYGNTDVVNITNEKGEFVELKEITKDANGKYPYLYVKDKRGNIYKKIITDKPNKIIVRDKIKRDNNGFPQYEREEKIYDIAKMPIKELYRIRGRQISMVFQEPMTSLNPVFTIGNQLDEVSLLHIPGIDKKLAKKRSLDNLDMVGIALPERVYNSYPHELSGGMRQRVMISMALAAEPRLIIADEPTTALDVTIQAQILDLFNDLKNKINGSIMLITHDLGVIAEMADYVIVMYAGRVIEQGTVNEIYSNPCHPYTQGLQKSKPTMNSSKDDLFNIPGNVPNPVNMPNYCYFKERCNKCLKKCNGEYPSMKQISPTHFVACHLFDDFIEKEEK